MQRSFVLMPGQNRTLNDVVRLDRFMMEPTNRIIEIWRQYHAGKGDTIAAGIPASKYDTFVRRTKECPMFVLPIKRGEGYLTLILQHQDNACLVTDLDSFNRFKQAAPSYAVLHHYDELKEEKGLVLMRGDVDLAKMTQLEAKLVSSLMHAYYLQDDKFEKYVYRFNKNPRDFNFEQLLGDLSLIQKKRQADDDEIVEAEEAWSERRKKDHRDKNRNPHDPLAAVAKLEEANTAISANPVNSSGMGNITDKTWTPIGKKKEE